MPSSRVQSFLAFYTLLDRLCHLPRTGWTLYSEISCAESVADHSYATACIALDYSTNLDWSDRTFLVRAMLLHDLAESIVGDIIPEPLSRVSATEKSKREALAMKEIVTLLRGAGIDHMGALYEEAFTWYEKACTPVAHAAHVIDKVDMLCQAHCYSVRYNVNLERFFTSCVSLPEDADDSNQNVQDFLQKLTALYKDIREQYKPPLHHL